MKKMLLVLAAVLVLATFTPVISLILKIGIVLALGYFANRELKKKKYIIAALSALGAIAVLFSMVHIFFVLSTIVALAAIVYAAYHKHRFN